MRDMWKRLGRAFASGMAFMAGIAALALVVGGLHAATLSLLTGPAGSNPAYNPAILADLNNLINLINSNASWAGTGTPSAAAGVVPISNSKLNGALTAVPTVQFLTWTTTTGSTTCNIANATICLGLTDSTATSVHWLAGTQ